MSRTTKCATVNRRAREKALHRRAILEAAERVFAAQGLDRATMEHIAREAEFSVGALYLFFRNKEVLWAEVIAKLAEDFLAAFRRETHAAPDPGAAIRALIRLKLRYAEEHGAFLRVFSETRPGSRILPSLALPRQCFALYDTYLDEAARLFKAAMDRGVLRPADPMYAALSLEGIVNTFRAYWLRRGLNLPLPEQARRVEQNFFQMTRVSKRSKDPT